ncbi:hypothetical protein CP965_00790 [Halarcobacter mediterraneus]|uniref:Uncharacterized protein n=1 Tax=Halarcobacter mediterraneus TaxID=2023153 RepID=A0A4Q1B4L4_9BACT|nr:hypothetical protein [Halarcobacter mediterraneus]RXK14017.1 hypothetical protein CP965_00790 [Halarcobacter mediterraneus]
MKVTNESNNIYTIYSQDNIPNKNNGIENESFSSQVSSEERQEKSPILVYLDKNNAFDDLSEDDASLFRELLSDNILDDKDMEKLSFEQTQIMKDFVLKDREGDLSLPVTSFQGKSFDLLNASIYTADDTFNRALYDTMFQTDDQRVRASYFHILAYNLSQLIADEEPSPYYVKDDPYSSIGANFGPHNKDKVNIDFNNFLNTYKSKLQGKLNETQDNIEIYKQFKQDFDFYSKLLNNFNKYS